MPALTIGTAHAQDTIKVGILHSLSGTMAISETTLKDTMLMMIADQNAKGGLLGKKLTLITRDDQTLPDKSVLAYNDLKSANVVAVIGSAFSNSALATLPFAERDGIPYLSLTPAEEQVQPIRSYVFVIPALSTTFAERYLADTARMIDGARALRREWPALEGADRDWVASLQAREAKLELLAAPSPETVPVGA